MKALGVGVPGLLVALHERRPSAAGAARRRPRACRSGSSWREGARHAERAGGGEAGGAGHQVSAGDIAHGVLPPCRAGRLAVGRRPRSRPCRSGRDARARGGVEEMRRPRLDRDADPLARARRRCARGRRRRPRCRRVRPTTWVSEPVGSTTSIVSGTVAAEVHRLGPQAVDDRRPPAPPASGRPTGSAMPSPVTKRPPSAGRSRPVSMFIAGEPMKPATKRLAGAVVEVERRADLLDAAVVHDDDLVGHGHRLDLVVGDVDRGGLQPLVQVLDLGAHRRRAAWRRGSTAARRTGRPAGRARWPGPWRRAGAGRRRAGADSGRAAAMRPRISAARLDAARRSRPSARSSASARRPCSRRRSCAGRARSSGTPWRCRAPSAAGR